jgi:hypothetical protein
MEKGKREKGRQVQSPKSNVQSQRLLPDFGHWTLGFGLPAFTFSIYLLPSSEYYLKRRAGLFRIARRMSAN